MITKMSNNSESNLVMKMSKNSESNVVLVSDVERPMDVRSACVCITNIVLLCATVIATMIIWGEYHLKTLHIINKDFPTHGNLRGISYR